MAKSNVNWKIIGTVLGLIVIGAGLVTDFTLQGAAIETVAKAGTETEKHVETLKEDGCNPVGQVRDRVLVLETNYKFTEKSLGKLEKGQVAMQETLVAIQKAVVKE